jgi:hypothetical protein
MLYPSKGFFGRPLNETKRRRPRRLQPNCEHEGGIGTFVPKTLTILKISKAKTRAKTRG